MALLRLYRNFLCQHNWGDSAAESSTRGRTARARVVQLTVTSIIKQPPNSQLDGCRLLGSLSSVYNTFVIQFARQEEIRKRK